jgi:hypothetical protein
MSWREQDIERDDEGRPMFEGSITLQNDKNEPLGGICWFFEDGPFYAHAMDVNDTRFMRRIGPCSTLEGAKRAIYAAIEGRPQ